MERGRWGVGGGVLMWIYTHDNLLSQLHLNLLPDLLPLLVAADGEDVAVLQLLLAGTVPELHGQQLFPHPAWEGPCRGQAKVSVIGGVGEDIVLM